MKPGMVFVYISSDNQVKSTLFLPFWHLFLSFFILYIFTCKKIFVLFLHYSDEIYKIKTNGLGKQVGVWISRSRISTITAKYYLI